MEPACCMLSADSSGAAKPEKVSNMEELCLTLHQPWASLVVYGIKRIEGRNWPTKHRGKLLSLVVTSTCHPLH